MTRNRLGPSTKAHPSEFDAIVIGGGITGVCMTRELAARGQCVLLLERDDYGSGTSSATTKYIHGGIRYLEQFDIAVVRESLRERRRFALAAPHLVSQRQFALPVWKWTKPGRLLLSAGALAYDALSFDRNRGMPASLKIGHPRWMGRTETLRKIPWLQPNDLHGAVVITDTLNVHPERLLLALLLDAIDAGAHALNHVGVTGFDLVPTPPGRAIRGVHARDQLTGAQHTFRTKTVINAAGPWVADVLGLVNPPIGPAVRPSKGVHLLTGPMRTGETSSMSVMARARNGSHVVVSPWQNRHFIGPTDTPVDGSPDDVVTEASDVDQILRVVNECRSQTSQLSTTDIADTTVGIRPLIDTSSTSDSSKLSRRHRIEDHTNDGLSGLHSVFGGKWTTARAIAEDAADTILRSKRPNATRSRPVAGVPGWGIEPAEVSNYVMAAYPGINCSPETRTHLARLYGTRAEHVLALAAEQPDLVKQVSDRADCNDIFAQVALAVTEEGARTLEDIVQRRLVLGTLGPMERHELTQIALVAAPLLGWPDGGQAEVDSVLARQDANRKRWHAA